MASFAILDIYHAPEAPHSDNEAGIWQQKQIAMTRYTTINFKRVQAGTMSPQAVQSYCEAKGLFNPDVRAVTITPNYVNIRPFNWAKKEFESWGFESDPLAEAYSL